MENNLYSPRTQVVPFDPTEAERGWLEKHPVIRVGMDPAWPPFSFFNSKGQLEGIDAEFIHELEKKLGVTFEIVRADNWAKIDSMLRDKQLDITAGTAFLESRLTYAQFTRPYMGLTMAVITRTDAPFLIGLSNLKGRKVAAPREHITTLKLQKDYPDLELEQTETLADALRLVSSGKADFTVAGLAPASYIIKNSSLTNLKIAGVTEYQFNPCFAVRNDWPEFVVILDKALDSIDHADRLQIVDRWITINYDQHTDWRKIWRVVGTLLAVGMTAFLVILIWNRRLALELAERRRVEKALRESEQELTDANDKLSDLNEEKDHLLGMAAHDLNTPLTAIIMGCEMMRIDRAVTSKEGMATLTDIQRSAERMSRLVRNLLNLRAIEQGGNWFKMQPVNLSAIVTTVVDRYIDPAAQKSIRLEFNNPSGAAIRVDGDKDAMDQIIDNLVSNAVKFTPLNGRVLVTTSSIGLDICVTVQDSGPGIKPEEIGQLFGKFCRLSAKPTGNERSSGLGLSIVQKLTEMMNGKICCEPDRTAGACFVVCFPRAATPPLALA